LKDFTKDSIDLDPDKFGYEDDYENKVLKDSAEKKQLLQYKFIPNKSF